MSDASTVVTASSTGAGGGSGGAMTSSEMTSGSGSGARSTTGGGGSFSAMYASENPAAPARRMPASVICPGVQPREAARSARRLSAVSGRSRPKALLQNVAGLAGSDCGSGSGSASSASKRTPFAFRYAMAAAALMPSIFAMSTFAPSVGEPILRYLANA